IRCVAEFSASPTQVVEHAHWRADVARNELAKLASAVERHMTADVVHVAAPEQARRMFLLSCDDRLSRRVFGHHTRRARRSNRYAVEQCSVASDQWLVVPTAATNTTPAAPAGRADTPSPSPRRRPASLPPSSGEFLWRSPS